MPRVITDFVLNTHNCYNSDYSSVRLSDWKLFLEFIGRIFITKKKRILIGFLWKIRDKPAAKQRWTTLRMSRPLVVGSHLQVTWWGLVEIKEIKICEE